MSGEEATGMPDNADAGVTVDPLPPFVAELLAVVVVPPPPTGTCVPIAMNIASFVRVSCNNLERLGVPRKSDLEARRE